MERPMYELIIGNIKDAREPNNPDENWEVSAEKHCICTVGSVIGKFH